MRKKHAVPSGWRHPTLMSCVIAVGSGSVISLAAPPFDEAADSASNAAAADYSEHFLEADDVFVEQPRRSSSDFEGIKPRFQPIEGER